MTIRVLLPQALAPDAAGTCDLALDLAPDSTLADLLALMRVQYPALARRLCDETGAVRRFVNIYIGDDESRTLQGLATPIPPDATLLVAGSVAGG